VYRVDDCNYSLRLETTNLLKLDVDGRTPNNDKTLCKTIHQSQFTSEEDMKETHGSHCRCSKQAAACYFFFKKRTDINEIKLEKGEVDRIPRAAAQSERHRLTVLTDQVGSREDINEAHLLEELGLASGGLVGRVAYLI
jgi:hypothetical protein